MCKTVLVFFACFTHAFAYKTMNRAFFNRLLPSAFISPLLHQPQRALIISCGDAGRAIAKQLRHDGYDITIATTKPKRVKDLSELGNVVWIPQIENQGDEILTESILKSEAVILADTIKIFSPHTFVRTAHRVRSIIERQQWKGTVGLVSSENAYGCPKNGESLYEKSNIYGSMKNRTEWKINTNVMAIQIRYAEQLLLDSAEKCFVMRTAGIWNEKTFSDVAMYTARKEMNYAVGESYMSFATTNLIGTVASKALKHSLHGVFNVANLPPMKRKTFLRSIHALHGLDDAVWTDEKPMDQDIMFSIDPNPFLPSSQRSNSKLNCNYLGGAMIVNI